MMTLAGCSGGGSGGSLGSANSLNPFNWFSNSGSSGGTAQLAPRGGYVQIADTRPLIDQLSALVIERSPGGVIVRAAGLAVREGYHSADLVRVASVRAREALFEFRVRAPSSATPIRAAHLRQIVAAVHLTNQSMRGIRLVRVIAARNSRTARP